MTMMMAAGVVFACMPVCEVALLEVDPALWLLACGAGSACRFLALRGESCGRENQANIATISFLQSLQKNWNSLGNVLNHTRGAKC